MAEIKMHEARFVDSDSGTTQIVQLPGTALQNGNVIYNEELHQGVLSCRFCEAAVHFHHGSKRIAGNNLNGQSPHFHTNPGQSHGEDCAWPLIHEARHGKRQYDERKGYKIHLNVEALSRGFNRRAGQIYVRGTNKKVISLVPDLENRRPQSVDGIADIVNLMERADIARLKDSVVVHQDHIVPWERFLVRYDYNGERGQDRFGNLIRALQQGTESPCLMEVFSDKAQHKGKCRPSLPVHWYTDARGREHILAPRLWIEDTALYPLISQNGRYLALGYPRHKAEAQEDKVIHYLNMSIRNRDQIAVASLPAIAAAAYKNHDRHRLEGLHC